MKRLEGQSNGASDAKMKGLFQAARTLLSRGQFEGVRVLHAEIVRREADAALSVPARYSSVEEARRYHEQLVALCGAQSTATGPIARLEQRLRRRPAWFERLAVAVIAAVLTLRYAWAVTHGKNWARQNPEGSWISRFYRNDKFAGYPLVRYDVGVNADFGARGPADSAPKDGFSARWDTCLVVTKDVVVPLQLTSDDSSKLFVDGRQQVEVEPGPGQASLSLSLQPGVRHLRVEFIERAGMALVRLEGLELEGTDAYAFRRPVIEDVEVRCP